MKQGIVLLLVISVLAVTAGCIDTQEQFPSEISSDNVNQTASEYENSSSFTWEGTEDDQSFLLKYDSEQSRAVLTQTDRNDDQVVRYFNENGSYVRRANGEVEQEGYESFSAFTQDLQQEDVVQQQFGLANTTLERNGTTMFKGEQVGVYRANDTQARMIIEDEFGFTPDEGADVEVVVYADSDGRIVYQEYTPGGYSTESSSTSLYAFNNTTVERPDWIDEVEPPIPEPNSIVFFEESENRLEVTVDFAGNADTLRVEYGGQVMETVDGESAVLENPEDGDTLTVKTDEYSYTASVTVVGVVERDDGSGAREEIVDRYYLES